MAHPLAERLVRLQRYHDELKARVAAREAEATALIIRALHRPRSVDAATSTSQPATLESDLASPSLLFTSATCRRVMALSDRAPNLLPPTTPSRKVRFSSIGDGLDGDDDGSERELLMTGSSERKRARADTPPKALRLRVVNVGSDSVVKSEAKAPVCLPTGPTVVLE